MLHAKPPTVSPPDDAHSCTVHQQPLQALLRQRLKMAPELPPPVCLVHDGRQGALAVVDCKAAVGHLYPGRLNYAHGLDWGVVVGDLQRLKVQQVRAAGPEVVHDEVVDGLHTVKATSDL